MITISKIEEEEYTINFKTSYYYFEFKVISKIEQYGHGHCLLCDKYTFDDLIYKRYSLISHFGIENKIKICEPCVCLFIFTNTIGFAHKDY